MTIDSERLEAARKMRENAGERSFTVWSVADAIGVDPYEKPGEYRLEDEVWNRLADLIEPEPERTCRNVGGEDGTNGEYYDFACSECGYGGDVVDPDYCPGCGAKVVEDGHR